MSRIFIGGSAASDSIPCRTFEKWGALLDALAAGDDEAVLRVALGGRPEQVATASLRSFTPRADEAAGLDEVTRRFWDDYAQKHSQPPAKRGTETEVSVPPGTPDRLAEIARRLAEDMK